MRTCRLIQASLDSIINKTRIKNGISQVKQEYDLNTAEVVCLFEKILDSNLLDNNPVTKLTQVMREDLSKAELEEIFEEWLDDNLEVVAYSE